MKAVQITQYLKSPTELKTTSSAPTPTPAAGEYLIAIATAACNFFDTLQLANRYQHQPPLPFILGSEFSGTVLSSPPGGAFAPGTLVFGASQGSYATHLCCPESALRAVPAGWTAREAAGLMVTAPTSYAALTVRANVKAGETVLVHAGAGGVGLAAIQVAKALGARVVATAGSKAKLDVCARFGADEGVLYGGPKGEWEAEVLRLTGGRGADVVFDPVGLVERSLKCTAWNGRIVVVGFAGGAIEAVKMNRVLLKNVSIVGLHWGVYSKREDERETVAGVWRGLEEMMQKGTFKPTVFDGVYKGLESVGQALEDLGARKTWGKVVVDVQEAGEKSRL
ncbi:hypothetical protein EDC01DRAFT_694001 [Geopyxis carbonaria]|nr:hypothetical protein EDC01DRAFT_694001 [Geopyxis carbonaria]